MVIYKTSLFPVPEDAKYLILGGGIAGLAAAKNLAGLNETDFLLLEGDSRLGGRVRSEQLGGKTVEVGAQWLNSLTSPIGELAKRAGVVSQSSDYDSYTIRDSTGADVSGVNLSCLEWGGGKIGAGWGGGSRIRYSIK